MKNAPVRVVSLILVATMALSCAACSSKGGSNSKEKMKGDIISEDDPWFDAKEMVFKPEVDPERKLTYLDSYVKGADDKYIIIQSEGSYELPTGAMILDSDSLISDLYVVDRSNGEVVTSLDINKLGDAGTYFHDIVYANGKITAKGTGFDSTSGSSFGVETDLDPATGNVLDTRKSEDKNDADSYSGNFVLSGYEVSTAYVYDENTPYYSITVKSPDGSTKSVDLKEGGKEIYDIPVILQLDKNTALVPAAAAGEYLFYKLDLVNCKLSAEDADNYNWFNPYDLYNSLCTPDGKVFMPSAYGIEMLDLAKKEMNLFFDYSYCYLNKSVMQDLALYACSEDSLLLAGRKYSTDSLIDTDDTELVIVTLSKASKNPNAGKTILELYSYGGYMQPGEAEAVRIFNETNPDFFIKLSQRYRGIDISDVYSTSATTTIDEMSTDGLATDAEFNDQLAIDIMNGEGPDIMLGTSSNIRLNRDDYLLDLTPYLGTFDSDKYFTNIIDASKTDGKIYQFPITYSISGIQTDSKYAGQSGHGFTIEEYAKFLNQELNGKDVITYGQAVYFSKLFDAQSDLFIKDGKADFTSPAFMELAKFVKDNVQEHSYEWDDSLIFDGSFYVSGNGLVDLSEDPSAMYTLNMSYSDYFSLMIVTNGNKTICGLPSSDGRGPSLITYSSVAIAAQTKHKDACVEFAKILISDEILMDFANNGDYTVSREVFREAGKRAVELYNTEKGRAHSLSSHGVMSGTSKYDRIKCTEQDLADLETTIGNCKNMNTLDSAIDIILIEEMPSYFSGQKEIDAVVKIAQDRTQKVLDERGK